MVVRTEYTNFCRPKGIKCEIEQSHLCWNKYAKTPLGWSAAYQLNRSPTSELKNDIAPNTYYSKTDLNKLRMFRSNFGSWKFPVRMVGFSVNVYRLWNPQKDDVLLLQDVRFHQNFDFALLQWEKSESELIEKKWRQLTLSRYPFLRIVLLRVLCFECFF